MLIKGRYEQQEVHKEGGQATVYLGRDINTEHQVVIKESSREDTRWLQREYELLDQLHHPNIPPALDFVWEGDSPLLILGHAPGIDFITWARQQRDLVDICKGVAAALRPLQYLHVQGVIHRDLKPQHLIVADTPIGRLPGVQLIDFGLASGGSLSIAVPATTGAVGTLGYAAPEALAGSEVTAASDMYSLGAVLYEVLFGELPNPSLDPSQATPSFPSSPALPSLTSRGSRLSADEHTWSMLREILTDLLGPEPEARPTAVSLMQALSRIAGEELQISGEELNGPYFPRPPLVGREAEIEQLRSAIEGLPTGHSGSIVVTGYGKSTLCKVAARLARSHGMGVVSFSSTAELLAHHDGEGSPQQLATQILDGWLEASRSAPLMMIADCSQKPAQLLEELLRQYDRIVDRRETSRCLLLWTGRHPDTQGSSSRTTLSLGPLAEHQIGQVVERMLYPREIPTWLAELKQTCRGDVCLAVDRVRLQIDAGLPDHLVPAGDFKQIEDQLLERLAAPARQLLGVLACAPRPVPEHMLRQVASRSSIDVQTALTELLTKELVTRTASGVRLASPIHSMSVCAALPPERLQQINSLFVEAWQDGPAEDGATLAHHLLRSGRLEQGVQLMLQTPTIDTEDLEWAASQLQRSSALRARVLRHLAHNDRSRGQLEAAMRRADDLGPAHTDAAELLRAELQLEAGKPLLAQEALNRVVTPTPFFRLLQARAYFISGDYREASKASNHGFSQSEQGDSFGQGDVNLPVTLANLCALSTIYAGDLELGLSRILEVEPAARALARLEPLARVLTTKGIALLRLDRLEQSRQAQEECLRLARQLGDLRIAATAALNLGTLEQSTMDFSGALSHFRQAEALASRGGATTSRITAIANEANLLLLCGEVETAASSLASARRISGQTGARSLAGHVEVFQAELDLSRREILAADRALQRARALFKPEDRSGLDAADHVELELLLEGDPARSRLIARQLLARLPAEARERGRIHLALGKIAARESQQHGLTTAVRELNLSLALGNAGGVWEQRWEAYALLTSCHHTLGNLQEARDCSRRFSSSLQQLRSCIPPEHRTAFDRRPDVRSAQNDVEALGLTDEPALQATASLERLLSINKELNRRLPLPSLLEKILDYAIEITGAERGFVLLQKSGALRVAAARNVDREAIRHGMEKFSRSIAETAIEQLRPLMLADAAADARFSERLSIYGLKLRAVVCAPFAVEELIRGALYVDNRFRPGAFEPWHVNLLQAFAEQAALALYNSMLLDDSNRHREALASANAKVETLNQQLQAQVVRQSQQLTEISTRLRTHEEELILRYSSANIIGESKPMRDLFTKMDRIAEADVPVFIHGESGTGKELVARALHHTGPRQDSPFITANCAAIPASLMESELFGHVKGAFTGASFDRAGIFEVAGTGTLLLDEIGDMPLEMQAKLLRILQGETFRRVGDNQERSTQCRVLSASHRSLDELVANGKFREDLFYRLNVIRIDIPPLRERRSDISLLIKHFLQQEGRRRDITPAAMAALIDHDWPGNVRQLENELQRALVLADDTINSGDLSPKLRPQINAPTSRGLRRTVETYEAQLIQATLQRCENNVSQAARELQIHRVALYKKMRKHGIQPARGKK